jgi:RNA polymerase sigma-32 factor
MAGKPKAPKGPRAKGARKKGVASASPAVPVAEAVEPEVLGPEEDVPDAEPADDSGPLLPEPSAEPIGADKALVAYSPLQRYLREIRRIPLLTREEEYALAVRFHDQGDVEAAYKLVTANLRLVVKIAMDFQRSFLSVMDLIQEGNIGLMQAVQKFDPYKGVKLSSYAAWWIKAYILRYLLNNWRMVKIGTTQAQRKLFYNLQKEKERLESMGFVPTPALLAARLDVTAAEVVEMDQRLGQAEVSLDAPIGEDAKGTVLDLVPSGDARPDVAVARADQMARVRLALDEFSATLSGKDLFIFEQRMVAEEPMTLQEIGDHFGVTRERIHQIEAALQKRLRGFLEERGIDEA